MIPFGPGRGTSTVRQPRTRRSQVASAAITVPSYLPVTLAFTPFALGPLRLRNRIVKPATFEGMCPGGLVSDALVEHHREVAAGGTALTTVAYASISADGRSYATQIVT